MSLSAKKRNEIVDFLLQNIRNHPSDIVKFSQDKFGLSRTTILRYLSDLQKQQIILVDGNKSHKKYSLLPVYELIKTFPITPSLSEDKVLREYIYPNLNGQKSNIIKIIEYGFTEIFNNAIDHSEGTEILVSFVVYPDQINLKISDNGIGIFNKIKNICKLDDPIHAILELSKGKLTTSPDSHTGEGIFFTSRMFDIFFIRSYGLLFGSRNKVDILFEDDDSNKGTMVFMGISVNSTRTTDQIFSEFAEVDHGFEKTIVPVDLVKYGNENLISRSQAKRMLNRLDKFKTVLLDFTNINQIGRAFADEVFRVFANAHPDIKIFTQNTTRDIDTLLLEIKQNKENS